MYHKVLSLNNYIAKQYLENEFLFHDLKVLYNYRIIAQLKYLFCTILKMLFSKFVTLVTFSCSNVDIGMYL